MKKNLRYIGADRTKCEEIISEAEDNSHLFSQQIMAENQQAAKKINQTLAYNLFQKLIENLKERKNVQTNKLGTLTAYLEEFLD